MLTMGISNQLKCLIFEDVIQVNYINSSMTHLVVRSNVILTGGSTIKSIVRQMLSIPHNLSQGQCQVLPEAFIHLK